MLHHPTDPTARTGANTSPCIAFRVVGSPIKTTSSKIAQSHAMNRANYFSLPTDVTEVLFALGPSDKGKESLSTNEYAVIAITSFCLGLMYIASVFLYIYLKKKKEQPSAATSVDLNKNFSREGEISVVVLSTVSLIDCSRLIANLDPNDFHNARSSYRRNSSLGPSVEFMDNPEPHVVKSNPLMKHFMSFNENNGFMSDSSDAESNANVHNDSPKHMSNGFSGDDAKMMHMNPDAERLPEEDVSITEDSDSKSDNGRAFHNGSVRRKLYFNPAYFEPNLLASPPPSAVEFLTKIREVITMAKGKMAAKRYQPSLNGIPEENSYHSGSEIYSPGTMNSRKSSVVSSRRASSKDCTGCPGCEAKKSTETPTSKSNCKNCGDKQKSIQKWLENVSTASDSDSSSIKKKKRPFISLPIMQEEDDKEGLIDDTEDDSRESPVKSSTGEIEMIPITKGYVKEKNIFIQRDTSRFNDAIEPAGSIPKIISHSLKKNIKEMIFSQNFVRDKVSAFESKQSTPTSPTSAKQFDEIYNNPKFNIDQDTSDASSRPYSAVVKKKGVVLDQYANPSKRSKTKSDSTLTQMPDMIYEAIEMEKKNKPIGYQLPTPDYYSSEYEMTKFKKSDGVSFIPFVPTPDYHTYGKNTLRSLKHYQPDSPIYSRKSPAYLVVDYETDSLERLNTLRSRTPISTPTRSDFSSQPSPSALPMEEEVEIRNAIYDRDEGFRKDSDSIKKEREIDIQMRKTKIMYNTPSEGSMTIELEAISPDENDEVSATDSDQFEPDTLDRHAKINKTVLEKIKLKNLENESALEEREKFDEMGRIMTLEVRHSKRQRNMGFASLEKLPEPAKKPKSKPKTVPPDVITSNKPLEENIYAKKSFQNAPPAQRITNQHILNEHEFKKSQISPPILTVESERKATNKTLRGEFLKMDLLKLETNFHQNQIRNEFKPSLIKTVYHVEIPTPNLDKEIFTDSGKKSKDFKNAWRRFMGIAEKNQQNNPPMARATTEVSPGKVKDIIKRLNVVQVDGGRREYDSGYLSAESMSPEMMQATEIIPKSESIGKSVKKMTKTRPQVPPPPVPVAAQVKTNNLNNEDLVNINIYSSDEEQHSSIADSDDDEGHLDDGTESGTESWKFFKT